MKWWAVPSRPDPVKALITFAAGARGTGKTAFVVQEIKRQRAKRLMLWDFKHDRRLMGVGCDVRTLPELARMAGAATFKARYLVDHGQDIDRQFHWFCRIAWEAGCLLMFVDELPEVSKPGRAPPEWRKCVNVGREYRGADGKEKWLSIMAAAQRPAECDKSVISNADVIHTGRLSFLDDAKYMAKTLGCKPEDLLNLPDLHWVEKKASERVHQTGILRFSTQKKAG